MGKHAVAVLGNQPGGRMGNQDKDNGQCCERVNSQEQALDWFSEIQSQ